MSESLSVRCEATSFKPWDVSVAWYSESAISFSSFIDKNACDLISSMMGSCLRARPRKDLMRFQDKWVATETLWLPRMKNPR